MMSGAQAAWPDTESDRLAFEQAKRELGDDADIGAVLRRAQEIKDAAKKKQNGQ